MKKRIETDKEFIAMTEPRNLPWMKRIYWGPRGDGTGRHGHLELSGSPFCSPLYARDIDRNELIKNGSELVGPEAILLVSEQLPALLRDIQDKERPFSFNVGSLDSIFTSKKESKQK